MNSSCAWSTRPRIDRRLTSRNRTGNMLETMPAARLIFAVARPVTGRLRTTSSVPAIRARNAENPALSSTAGELLSDAARRSMVCWRAESISVAATALQGDSGAAADC
ncbi:Uncharacterised protein [Mycobacteroides abscessus subsp. abscessus]|nr:Uncharacterised protein [Mycobacteroides abscessus subsp. abscessus]